MQTDIHAAVKEAFADAKPLPATPGVESRGVGAHMLIDGLADQFAAFVGAYGPAVAKAGLLKLADLIPV